MMRASPPTAQRVLVVDDQLVVRAGLAALLEAMPGWCCVGTAATAAAALRACGELQPDLVLLDLHLEPCPGVCGTGPELDLARALLAQQPRVRILVLAERAPPEVLRAALRSGACGVIGKDFVHDELEQALHNVTAGQRWLSPTLAAALREQERSTPALTTRQREVLALLARGQPNKQIARSLGVSVKTVEYHRAELIARLDLHDVASLTRFAVAQGLAG
ncbi:MAG: response regulator transcription factor [Rubrivivax sp.]|nr:response regulator transcription factor [Rubrivivax sp.]